MSRQRRDVVAEVMAYSIGFAGLSADNRAERIAVSYVTSNYFSMLGVQPALGRLIQPTEGVAYGADPVIVLGHSFWKKRFNGDATCGRPDGSHQRAAVHDRRRSSPSNSSAPTR